jgi:hypothetical protein
MWLVDIIGMIIGIIGLALTDAAINGPVLSPNGTNLHVLCGVLGFIAVFASGVILGAQNHRAFE